LSGGHEHDLKGADVLLPQVTAAAVLADKAYHALERVIHPLEQRGISAIIPPKKNHTSPRAIDKDLYKPRHLIENFFSKLKQFRGIATRYDKTARNFLAAIQLASSTILLN